MGFADVSLPAQELVRRNVRTMMDWRGWTQAEMAERVHKTQPWLSKRLNGVVRFQIEDLDQVAAAFLIPLSSLLEPGGLGEYERRTGHDRRSGKDRRKTSRETHPAARDRLTLDSGHPLPPVASNHRE